LSENKICFVVFAFGFSAEGSIHKDLWFLRVFITPYYLFVEIV